MSNGTFERIDVTDWSVIGVETSGSTRNLWLQDPKALEGPMRYWLHKDTVIPENGEEQGEDWSEILGTRVAVMLGVPCAATALCTRGGRRGSISQNIRPEGTDLHGGGVALEQSDAVTGYVPHREGAPGRDPRRPAVRRPGHSLANLKLALAEVGAPAAFDGTNALDGFDVFCGYLLLDALIANRDRHEQNWAVLVPQLTDRQVRLAPTYDHASSLGYNLRDAQRERCLADAEVLARWARNGTAYRFEHEGRPQTLVDLAVEAMARCSDDGRRHWSNHVAALNLEPLFSALDEHPIPEMSEAAGRFVRALLEHNLGRLRDAISRSD